MQKLTPKEADNVIRASWPMTAHRANGCDYQGRHPEAAECCTDIGADDDKPRPWLRRIDLGTAIALVAAAWAVPILLAWAMGAWL